MNGNGSAHPPMSELTADMLPTFANMTGDYHLLENLVRYARVCEHFNVGVPQMAQTLARAIGLQNESRYNVIIYDYLNAIPDYPPTQNGMKSALVGEGRMCQMICYKNILFGVCIFPATDNVTFYFPGFTSYNQLVQRLIFTYGNKSLRYCPMQSALVFDFRPVIQIETHPEQQILVTATLKSKLALQDGMMVLVNCDSNDGQQPCGDQIECNQH
ncbi:unnamed protein product [Orchesella dallaii]|uniref:Uncharacterized protein n=1 Tax=Orchesella dallaii TaxID=48710 RepID=A0ABP1Q4P6_9HEXA